MRRKQTRTVWAVLNGGRVRCTCYMRGGAKNRFCSANASWQASAEPQTPHGLRSKLCARKLHQIYRAQFDDDAVGSVGIVQEGNVPSEYREAVRNGVVEWTDVVR